MKKPLIIYIGTWYDKERPTTLRDLIDRTCMSDSSRQVCEAIIEAFSISRIWAERSQNYDQYYILLEFDRADEALLLLLLTEEYKERIVPLSRALRNEIWDIL